MAIFAVVSFDPDRLGFTSRACPKCGKRFKVALSKGDAVRVKFCPFCCHEGGRWETPEQIAYQKARGARTSKTRKPVEREGDLPERATFACCAAGVRHDAENDPRFCPVCGVRAVELS